MSYQYYPCVDCITDAICRKGCDALYEFLEDSIGVYYFQDEVIETQIRYARVYNLYWNNQTSLFHICSPLLRTLARYQKRCIEKLNW